VVKSPCVSEDCKQTNVHLHLCGKLGVDLRPDYIILVLTTVIPLLFMQLLQILFDLRYFMIVLVVVLAMFGDMLNIGEFCSLGCFQTVS
jgi:hypothetical protein